MRISQSSTSSSSGRSTRKRARSAPKVSASSLPYRWRPRLRMPSITRPASGSGTCRSPWRSSCEDRPGNMHAVEAQRGCNAPVDTDVRRGYVSTNQRVSATADEDGIGEPDTSCADAHTVARKHTIGGCGAVRAESGWFLGQAEALEACVELEARCGSN